MSTLTLQQVRELAESHGWEIHDGIDGSFTLIRGTGEFHVQEPGLITLETDCTSVPDTPNRLLALEAKGYRLIRRGDGKYAIQTVTSSKTDIRNILGYLGDIKTALECYARDMERARACANHDFEINTLPVISQP